MKNSVEMFPKELPKYNYMGNCKYEFATTNCSGSTLVRPILFNIKPKS